MPRQGHLVIKINLEDLVKIRAYSCAFGALVILSLGLLSCGQIKQKQSKQKDNEFKLMAKVEEPKVLDLDLESIYQVLNGSADPGFDRHCKFIEKAVTLFNETYINGVDYLPEKCHHTGGQERELRFKMERKGSALEFLIKVNFQKYDDFDHAVDEGLQLYAYNALFKEIDSNGEQIEYQPKGRDKYFNILHTKLSHIGKTLTQALTFDQKKNREECFKKGRLFGATAQKCLFDYKSDKKFEDLNIPQYDPMVNENERKEQLGQFLQNFHNVVLQPIEKGKVPSSQNGADTFHSSYLRDLSFDPSQLVKKKVKDGNQEADFYNYTFSIDGVEGRSLEIAVYNLLDKQKSDYLKLMYVKSDGSYHLWDINKMNDVDILHPNMALLGSFFESFNKSPFANTEVADPAQTVTPEEQLNIELSEQAADYEDFFRKTRIRYDNLFLEYLNLPYVAFKLHQNTPLPRNNNQEEGDIGLAYMEQVNVSFNKFKFNHINFDHFDFNQSEFQEGLFIDCSLAGVNFQKSRFKNVSLDGSEFALIKVKSNDGDKIVQPFKLTQMEKVSLEAASFAGLREGDDKVLLDLSLVGKLVEEDEVKNHGIEVASMKGATFKLVDFGDMKVLPLGVDDHSKIGIDMSGVSIEECLISNKSFFENADLSGAKIINTEIDLNASFAGATVDKDTKFKNSLGAFDSQDRETNFRKSFGKTINLKDLNWDETGCSLCKKWASSL